MYPAVRVPRMHPWIVVAVVVVLELLVIAAVLLAPMALHAMNGFLQSTQPHAGNCPGMPIPC